MELQFCVSNVDCFLSVCYEILPEICTNSEILLKGGVGGKGKKLKFTPEQAMKAQGGNRDIAILLHSLQCYMRLGG